MALLTAFRMAASNFARLRAGWTRSVADLMTLLFAAVAAVFVVSPAFGKTYSVLEIRPNGDILPFRATLVAEIGTRMPAGCPVVSAWRHATIQFVHDISVALDLDFVVAPRHPASDRCSALYGRQLLRLPALGRCDSVAAREGQVQIRQRNQTLITASIAATQRAGMVASTWLWPGTIF